MKKTLLLLCIFGFVINYSAYPQQSKWSTISYSTTSGPISPEYQYNYSIIVNNNGSAKLVYTKSSTTNEYDFTITKSELKSLNGYLIRSKVLSLNADDFKTDKNLLGGAERKMLITLWQSPELDSEPPTVEIPKQIRKKYSENVFKLYGYIEKLVPESIWKKAMN